MPAGTIALTNNSTAVTGTGTSFAAELKANDFVVAVVGGVAYTLGIKSVDSNTALTLAQAYTGPAASGLAWTPVPFGTMTAITAQLAAQVTYAVRGFNLDKANWQGIFTGTGNVTVNLPDGTSWSGPSWGYMTSQFSTKADKTALEAYAKKGANSDITSISGLTTALSIAQGGTGANSRESAKTSLETGFLRNTQSWSNFLTMVNGLLPNGGVISLRDNTSGSTIYQYANAFVSRNGDTMAALSVDHATGNVVAVGLTTTPLGANGNALWGSRNTTIDSNGFIKRASPIVRVFSGDFLPADYDMSGFVRAGQCMANEEAEGVVATRVSEGVYELTGCLGLATESWTIEIPQDSNGYRQIYIQSSFDNERLLIKTYHRVNADAPKFLQNIVQGKVDGDPIDIPSGRWVDMRLSMPGDSIYNTRLKKLKLAAE